jgi:hypothetical protein
MGDRRRADVALVVARLGGGACELWFCPHVPISSQPTCRPAGLSVGSSPCQRRNVRCGHATFVWSCGPERLARSLLKRHLVRGWGTSSPRDHPAAYPAAASPAPAATDPCSSSPSDAGHPRKAGARTWTSPGAPAAQAHQPAPKAACSARSAAQPARSAQRSAGTPPPAAPPARRPAARTAPQPRAGQEPRTQLAMITIPARQSTTRPACHPAAP